MPKNCTINKVLIIGSGPIVIGQACEFDYSGTQAIKALRDEGVHVVLLNCNPATVMTDPSLAQTTYIEPITKEVAVNILEAERPDALLATMGGQTALNLAKELAEAGELQRLNVQLIGASLQAINTAEDRQLFKQAMQSLGLDMAKSEVARSMADAKSILTRIGLPASIRPSFTLGGTGGGIANTEKEYLQLIETALRASPSQQVLIEESLVGYKEFELELMRDAAGHNIVVCGIENIDPMGVHTGDSITVAPCQTLTDKEYQRMRAASFAIMEAVGLSAGGCNIQFGVHPTSGRLVVIEMNPRVSRSSALASKATGYPIAKISAKLALGYTLDELANDMTGGTSACFEAVIDYVVVKMPRFAFEKFHGSSSILTTSMRSVGEAMGIGRTFQEAYLKALRSLELGRLPLAERCFDAVMTDTAYEDMQAQLRQPTPERPFAIFAALARGISVPELHAFTHIDPWFLTEMAKIVAEARSLHRTGSLQALAKGALLRAKRIGLSDAQVAQLTHTTERQVRQKRHVLGIKPSYKTVDTCAAEYAAATSIHYSSYEPTSEVEPITAARKVLILGGGPVRIGQGVEFDCCCVSAAATLQADNIQNVMLNSNPETVSTDFDASDRLYFEPVTLEDVLHVVANEQPHGVIVQLGGQTPLRLAKALEQAGIVILGTSPDAIDRAEDRGRFAALCRRLGLQQPDGGIAYTAEDAFLLAERIGYPVMVRPSYVLGGRSMQVVADEPALKVYLATNQVNGSMEPLLVDRYLLRAVEVDLDLVADGQGGFCIGGLLEHVEHAGVHSGDATSVMPPHTLAPSMVARMEEAACAMASELHIVGLMNVQFAVQDDALFVLEVNPRASRTVPFIEKATGLPLVAYAVRAMMGQSLASQRAPQRAFVKHVAVKEAVFPWSRFAHAAIALGPEMRSTGEVMGLSHDLPTAMAKAQRAAGHALPSSGSVLLCAPRKNSSQLLPLAHSLSSMGFSLCVTPGLHHELKREGVESTAMQHGEWLAKAEQCCLIVAMDAAPTEAKNVLQLRRIALQRGIPCCTSIELAKQFIDGLRVSKVELNSARPLKGYLSFTDRQVEMYHEA